MKPLEAWGQHYLFPEQDFPNEGTIARNMAMLALFLDTPFNQSPIPLTYLRMSRAMLANMLVQTAEFGNFDNYCLDNGWEKPTHEDQKQSLRWLQWFASVSGALHANEVEWLSHFVFGNVPKYIDNIENKLLLDGWGLEDKVEEWGRQGQVVGAFQGAFDGPHNAHLCNATFAHLWAQYHGIKLKLIWWFDNDKLIKRKGIDRPRYSLNDRRQSVEGLWQVGATGVATAESVDDIDGYLNDYLSTNTKFIFVTDDEPLDPRRIKTATLAEAEIVTLPAAPFNFHSSTTSWHI